MCSFIHKTNILCTAAAEGEKVTGSSENLIPGLGAFSGETLFNSSLRVV